MQRGTRLTTTIVTALVAVVLLGAGAAFGGLGLVTALDGPEEPARAADPVVV